MENYIKGSYLRSIYEGSNGYIIGILKLKETDIDEFIDYIGKTITFTGYFDSLNSNDNYIFYGGAITHPRYGLQFSVTSYETIKPTDKLGVITFLSSELFPGIGNSIATKIVDTLGENVLDLILKDPNVLRKVPKLSEKKRITIITNLEEYNASHNIILYLTKLGFSMKEALSIYNLYRENTIDKIGLNIYDVLNYIEISFIKIDKIAIEMGYSTDDANRIKACIIYVMKNMTFNSGDIYLTKLDILKGVMDYMHTSYIYDLDKSLDELKNTHKIVIEDDRYYLKDMYDDEEYIVKKLYKLSNIEESKYKDIDNDISKYETEFNLCYDVNQKNAIKTALLKNIVIITGGPGTGKTTTIKAIVDLYAKINKIKDVSSHVALLAPTGRAAKKISEACLLPASTIHRFLKWNKEDESFAVNDFNKDTHDMIIVDEVSMIDEALASSLLKGIKDDAKLILVGDYNQLPSVGPGQILKDLIDSSCITTIYLDKIYRQNEDSYIVTLASEIKDNIISENINKPTSDYIFLECENYMINNTIKKIVDTMVQKDMDLSKVQIMAPMYKGESGIDNLNCMLQNLLNPSNNEKIEIHDGNTIYREGDKVLQLLNMPDDNIYNGDIGYIIRIDTNKKEIYVSFDGNIVKYTSKDFNKITLGYIVSIHKAQGSEFDTVILPMSPNYSRMLYKKLIYTAVTRTKRKLIIVGDINAFKMGILNIKEDIRKTSLKLNLMKMYKIFLSNPQ